MDSFGNYSDFFDVGSNYFVKEYNSNTVVDYSMYVAKHDEYGNSLLKNMYTYILPDGNVHKNIIFDLKSSKVEEIMEDDRCKCCYVNYYTINKGTLSSNGKELVLNIVPIQESDSKNINTMSIIKL